MLKNSTILLLEAVFKQWLIQILSKWVACEKKKLNIVEFYSYFYFLMPFLIQFLFYFLQKLKEPPY